MRGVEEKKEMRSREKRGMVELRGKGIRVMYSLKGMWIRLGGECRCGIWKHAIHPSRVTEVIVQGMLDQYLIMNGGSTLK